ncbi:MAG: hypothetical protein A2252_05710 [Elusimicrobia bacterium RIFOXYA2_FULL_39_19]|nr:MAG: hypothetical protein A2252_05710 [Elusimicrobia bacterium RIFOXYA2_FULL_39_19]
MNCNKYQNLIPLYLEEKLNPSQKKELENHTSACIHCAAFLKDFKEITGTITNIAAAPLPEAYLEKLEAKINLEELTRLPYLKENGFTFNIQKLLPVFGVVLLVFCIGYYLKSGKDRTAAIIQTSQHNYTATQNITANPSGNTPKSKPIETKKTIEFVKANAPAGQFILRGAGPKYQDKKIVKQWQDVYSAIKEKKSLMIENKKDWQELWKQHSAHITPAPALPEVDFNVNLVIAVFMGQQNAGGYGIQVSKIEESENKVYIETIETVPAKETNTSKSTTAPYHIVVIQK